MIQDDEKAVGFEPKKLLEGKPADYLVRFGFGALIAVVAALVTMKFGAMVGGLFLAFPAVLPASLTLIEKKEGKEKAIADASGGMIGAVGLAGFALTAHFMLKAMAPTPALLIALVVWSMLSAGLYAFVRATGLVKAQDRLVARSAPPG